jgi:3-deoxy-7-phosphoheptulonate synthase
MAIRALELGFPLADEMLNPHLVEYVDDYLSYIAVGARSTENQYHREVSSGLDVPVGFKNPTS